jgi:hypothetical protein
VNEKAPEFDIYTCENGHLLIVERKPEWGGDAMTEVGCQFCRGVAEYRTTAKEPELYEAVQRFIIERKGDSAIAEKVYAVACEKIAVCPAASDRCRAMPYLPGMRTVPARRWVDCYAWKQQLGLILLKSVGVYHMQFCPFCGCNLEEELKRKGGIEE